MVNKVVKGDVFEVEINTFATAGSTPLSNGSAYAVQAGTSTRIAGGVTLSADPLDPGVARIRVDTAASTVYDRGLTFHVRVASASVGAQLVNLNVGTFEVDTEILLRTGVVSANTSTLVVSASISDNNLFVGGAVRVTRGTGNRTPGHIITLVSASPDNRIKVTPAFGVSPDNTSKVEILASPYVEDLSAIPANLTQVVGVDVSAPAGYNFNQLFNNANSSASLTIDILNANLAAVLNAVNTNGVVVGSLLSAAADDILDLASMTESTAAPDWANMTLREGLTWVVVRTLNAHQQTATTKQVLSSAGAVIASASASEDGTTARSGRWL